MFHSAKLKLTLFYLGIILAFSLSLTLGFRLYAGGEFTRSNREQRGSIRTLVRQAPGPQPFPNTEFETLQRQQEDLVRSRLNAYLFLVNLGALVVGGILSYWFAGRTLRPIEEAHETQARFAADASHELRTPLAAMRTENEVFLRQKGFSKDEAKALIASNLEEIERLENLATNLLALTQYDKASLPLEPVSIKEIVESALDQTDKIQKQKKQKISQTIEDSEVTANRDSLVQLISILLDNAFKYSPTKSIITIAGVRDNGAYKLTIADQGPGIDEADLPHIFDRLYRGDKARASIIPGYGLGLSLAEVIASVNHTEITAANDTNGGAIFTIKFNS